MDCDGLDECYTGNTLLLGVARLFHIQVDQLNFILSQIVAVFLASLFRTTLHPHKTPHIIRHLFGLVLGVFIGYFCFGRQAFHLIGLPALCYVIIRTQNANFMQGMVLAVAMMYLSLVHIHRQIVYYNSYSLDVTGPLMVITQKVTNLAFNIHDGSKKESDLTKTQEFYAVKSVPSFLEYFSYILQFPTLMAGPVIFYRDYTEFISGSSYKTLEVNGKDSTDNTNGREPSPHRAVFKKVFLAVIYAVAYIKLVALYPIRMLKEENFLKSTSVAYKFWFLGMSTMVARLKYYFAWTLSDAICNNAGIGFNGYDEKGMSKWDKFTNVFVLKFELSTSLKESIEAWNTGTNQWLRFVIYERVKKYRTISTYAMSALWHGFYPGYYLTFANGALFTFAARNVRRKVRKYFLGSEKMKLFYDCLTFLCTRLVMAYITFCFLLLELWSSIRLYSEMFWCLHILAIFAIVAVPRLVP